MSGFFTVDFWVSTLTALIGTLGFAVLFKVRVRHLPFAGACGLKKVSFNNKKVPKDYFITMNTVEKDEEGTLTPYIITAYKAAIERNLELSFSSEGDPASLTITFNLLADKDGNVMDIMEDTENAE